MRIFSNPEVKKSNCWVEHLSALYFAYAIIEDIGDNSFLSFP